LRLIEGTPQGRETGVAFFLVTFSLAKQEKVTSCRATPGEVDFGVGHSCFDFAAKTAATLMELLAIRLSCQNTTAKSLVISTNGLLSLVGCVLGAAFVMMVRGTHPTT
jgi:hypothetical protein